MLRSIFSRIAIICLAAILLVSASACSKDAREIRSATVNAEGELILTYSDGSEENLGVVTGKDGENGKDGKDGATGVQGEKGDKGETGDTGAAGADGKDGQSGTVTVVNTNNAVTVAATKGLRSAVRIRSGFTKTALTSPTTTNTYKYWGVGSGVIYKYDRAEGDAFIITNMHVIYSSESDNKDGISTDISVFIYGSETESQAIPAVFIGGSQYYDIAVLRVEDSELLRIADVTAVDITNSDDLRAGDHAIAVGNPKGEGLSVSSGIVSVTSEYLQLTGADGMTNNDAFRVMRIDTAINSGNSGGGLYDISGRLIGIVNAKLTSSSVENIAYAIPSNVAIAVADNIIDHCFGTECKNVMRAKLGITVNTDNSMAKYDPETGKVTVSETVITGYIESGSLAYGRILEGDILLYATVGDHSVQITRQYHIIDIMLHARVGDTLVILLSRDSQIITVELTVNASNISAS